jgi:hypothetical protein
MSMKCNSYASLFGIAMNKNVSIYCFNAQGAKVSPKHDRSILSPCHLAKVSMIDR